MEELAMGRGGGPTESSGLHFPEIADAQRAEVALENVCACRCWKAAKDFRGRDGLECAQSATSEESRLRSRFRLPDHGGTGCSRVCSREFERRGPLVIPRAEMDDGGTRSGSASQAQGTQEIAGAFGGCDGTIPGPRMGVGTRGCHKDLKCGFR